MLRNICPVLLRVKSDLGVDVIAETHAGFLWTLNQTFFQCLLDNNREYLAEPYSFSVCFRVWVWFIRFRKTSTNLKIEQD